MDLSRLLSSKVNAVQLSPIRRFFNLVSSVPGALSLTIGQPDFNTPEKIKNAGIDAIKDNYTTYTPNQGYTELRKEICNYLSAHYNLTYNPEDEIIVTNGASQAIDSIIRTFIDKGDEVIIPSPSYVAYGACVTLSGGNPVYVPTSPEDGFKLRAHMIKKYITSRTKILILSYPSNPTGATMDLDDLVEICEVAKDKDILVISDEIYSELTYGKKHVSPVSVPGMKERTVLINGFSKSYSMTGWRLGYIAAPSFITEHILKVHQYNVSCASSISQKAGIEALRHCSSDVESMVTEYNKRRLYCYDRLKDMGLQCFVPTGAFYIFPEIKQFKMTSEEFSRELLFKGKLAVVPGSAFGESGEGHIRISYAYSMEVLEEGLNRLEDFIKTLEHSI